MVACAILFNRKASKEAVIRLVRGRRASLVIGEPQQRITFERTPLNTCRKKKPRNLRTGAQSKGFTGRSGSSLNGSAWVHKCLSSRHFAQYRVIVCHKGAPLARPGHKLSVNGMKDFH